MVVKNIIFDLGGIFINLDFNRTKIAFETLGISNFDEIYTQAKQNHLFDHYETGKMNDEDFIAGLKNHLDNNAHEDLIIEAWNAMLLDFPKERMEFLLSVKNKYRIFLLSNTNNIHIKAFENILYEQHGIRHLDPLFEKAYYSSRIGLRKPEHEIFDFVVDENKLNKSETIFFDDSIQHINGAQSAGIKAIFVTKPKTILNFFDKEFNIIES